MVRPPHRDYGKDLESLGRVMKQILEPESLLSAIQSTKMELSRPDDTDTDAVDFFVHICNDPCAKNLLEVSISNSLPDAVPLLTECPSINFCANPEALNTSNRIF